MPATLVATPIGVSEGAGGYPGDTPPLIPGVEASSMLTATEVLFYEGTFPGANVYPGSDEFPGGGTFLQAASVAPLTLTGAPA